MIFVTIDLSSQFDHTVKAVATLKSIKKCFNISIHSPKKCQTLNTEEAIVVIIDTVLIPIYYVEN